MPRLVADGAALQAGLRLEQGQVLLVEDDLALGGNQATEDLFAGLFLDFVPIQIQPQDLFDNLLDRPRLASFAATPRSCPAIARCGWRPVVAVFYASVSVKYH
jgi:hypothetical protein